MSPWVNLNVDNIYCVFSALEFYLHYLDNLRLMRLTVEFGQWHGLANGCSVREISSALKHIGWRK